MLVVHDRIVGLEICLRKKLTITLDKSVYDGLHSRIGKRGISQFIEGLVRPHVISRQLDAAYREMSADPLRESEALAWAEELVADINHEPR